MEDIVLIDDKNEKGQLGYTRFSASFVSESGFFFIFLFSGASTYILIHYAFIR